MFYRSISIVLLVAGACGPAGEAPSTDDAAVPDAGPPAEYGELTIMTWNLREFPLSSSAVPTAIDVIEEQEADLIAVQEIENVGSFNDLANALPGYAAVIADDPEEISRVGLLYRTDRISVTAPETLFADNSWAFPRPVLRVEAETLGSEPFDFIFLVVHLKAYTDEESRMRRELACMELDAWLRTDMEGSDELDYILAGDFNDEITRLGDENVFAPFLDHPESYRFLTSEIAARGDYSYVPWESLIDHILVTSDALVEYGDGETETLPLEEEVDDYTFSVSDHRPVVARFAF